MRLWVQPWHPQRKMSLNTLLETWVSSRDGRGNQNSRELFCLEYELGGVPSRAQGGGR